MKTHAQPWLHLKSVDPTMKRLVKQFGPIKLLPRKNATTFSSLCRSIIGQQLSSKAARTIYARFAAQFPGGKHEAAEFVAKKSTAHLRKAGLSQAKAKFILTLAEAAINGDLPSVAELKAMPDEQIFEVLTQFDGVGPWTAEMVMIFILNRPNVLPLSDVGLQRGFALAYKTKATVSKLQQRGKVWQPFCSTASLYLWRVADGGGISLRNRFPAISTLRQ